MSEVSKQILFISALHDFPFHPSWKQWTPMSTNIQIATEHLSTQNLTAANPDGDGTILSRDMTTLEKRLIQDCIFTFYIRVKTIKSCFSVNKTDDNPDPDARILDCACRVFIGCFNSYISNFEGLLVNGYGIIKTCDLKIESVHVFSKILQETVNLDFLPNKIQTVASNYLSIMKMY